MPNRVTREGILTSERVNMLSEYAEVFYRRLMSVADDFGRYSANLSQLRAACFPLRLETVSNENISQWLRDCQDAKLIDVYESKGGFYLEILDFNQRTRVMRAKWPLRIGEFIEISEGEKGGKCFTIKRQSNDGQLSDATQNKPSGGPLTVMRRSDDGLNPNPTPNPTRGEEECRTHDGPLTVIQFEPLPSPLFPATGEKLLAMAKAEVQKIKNDPKNFIKDLTTPAEELIAYLTKEKPTNWQARVEEVYQNEGSYDRRNPKPKTAALLKAWSGRITDIRNAMNGIKN